MLILNTNPKRKSAVITSIILILLIFLVFNFGMYYTDPPKEYGLLIRLRNTTIGNSQFVKNAKKQLTTPKQIQKTIPEKVEKTSSNRSTEKIITSTTSKKIPIKKLKPREKPTQKRILKKVQNLKPSKQIQDALNNLLNGNTSDGKPKEQGDNDKSRVKEVKKGDPNTSKYYLNSGNKGNKNYNLLGRKVLVKPIKKPDCQEEGLVVVSIEVNREGTVTRAIPGVKGSTNTAPCLLKPAKEAALHTKWNLDLKAPEKQKGTIIYRFSLSK